MENGFRSNVPKIVAKYSITDSFSKKTAFYPKKQIEINDVLLDQEITLKEIKACILGAKCNKAAGLDEISYEFLKALPENCLFFLKDFFNKIYSEQQTPKEWSKILISMIHKKGDLQCLENYRPIALVNCLTKIFTGILKGRLERWLETKEVLSEEQAGFRKNRGCRDNIFILDSLIKSGLKKKGGILFAFFIDFVTAFLSLNHKILWEKMEKIGISTKFINTCRGFYDYASMAERTEEGCTEFVEMSKGVMQGETLSSGLFLIFISDLVLILIMFDLKGIGIGGIAEVQALGYADDFVILATSYVEMQKKIKVIEEYCQLNELRLNTKKSKILIFHEGNINYNRFQFRFEGTTLEVVKSFTYLGVDFSSSGLFVKHFERISSTARIAMSSTIQLIRSNKIVSWESIETLYNTLIYNTITYSSEVWGLDFLSEFDKMQANYYKSLFWLSKSCPLYATRVEFRLRHTSVKILKRVLNWADKVHNMKPDRLPQLCLTQFEKQIDAHPKFNWLNKIFSVLFNHRIQFQRNLNFILVNKIELLIQYENSLMTKDWAELMNNQNLTLGKELLVKSYENKYFELDLSLNLKRIIAQIRLAVNNYGSIYIKGSYLRFRVEENCKLCNTPKSWNIKHLLIDCSNTKNERDQLFGNEISEWDDWINTINSNDLKILRKIVILLHKIVYKMQNHL